MIGDVKALVDVAFGKFFGEIALSTCLECDEVWLKEGQDEVYEVRWKGDFLGLTIWCALVTLTHKRGHANGFFVISKVLAVPCPSHVCHWTGKESYMTVKNETDNKKLHLCIKRSLQCKLLKGLRRNVHMMKTFNSTVNINRTSEWECSLANRNVSGVWSSLSLSRPIWRVGLEVCVRMRIFDSRQGTYLSLLPTQF